MKRFVLPFVGIMLLWSSTAQAQGVLYRVQRHRVAGVPADRFTVYWPRVMGGVAPAVRARLNDSLDALARETIYWDGCSGDARAQVTKADARFLSFIVDSSLDCGGAHPNNSVYGYTLDVATGRKIDLGIDTTRYQALWVAAYREMLPQMRRDSIRESRKPENEQGCASVVEVFRPSSWYRDYLLFALSKDGLLVWPELPHAIVGCTRKGFIPYSRLQPFLTPNSPLR